MYGIEREREDLTVEVQWCFVAYIRMNGLRESVRRLSSNGATRATTPTRIILHYSILPLYDIPVFIGLIKKMRTTRYRSVPVHCYAILRCLSLRSVCSCVGV